MSKNKLYCIYNKYNRTIAFKGSYSICLEKFRQSNKEFRLKHKIIEYNESN